MITFKKSQSGLILLVLFMFTGHVQADVKLAKLFSDHMMIQRGKPVKVWGMATSNSKVKCVLAGKTIEVTAGADGNWQGQFPALDSGENLELVVTENNTITIKDIIVGDIWLCSGQSNMEYKIGNMGSMLPNEIKEAELPKIRYFEVGGIFTTSQQKEVGSGIWQVCSPNTVTKMTAVGYFFARDIHTKTKVPIGILEADWSGTSIEPWICREGLLQVPGLKNTLEKIDKGRKDWQNNLPRMADDAEKWAIATREAVKTGGEVPPMPNLQGAPGYNVRDYWSNIYNSKIFPLIRFPIKGALWYQGESNGGEGEGYTDKMQALIGGWREVWNQGDFPFYFVQLANFGEPNDVPAGGDGWSRTRSAQMAALKIPNTGMASAIDVGEAKDIHPKDKVTVGLRLARWALMKDYGEKDVVVSGPLYKEMKVEGAAIRISFDHIGSGLMVGKKPTIETSNWRDSATVDKDAKLKRFAIAGADKLWYWADAIIDGKTVLVSSPKVPVPVAVRYAFSHNPLGANLYNQEGLPASSFCTDNWK